MYSIALLVALTGGGEVNDGHRGGCGGGGHRHHGRHHGGCCGYQDYCGGCQSSCGDCGSCYTPVCTTCEAQPVTTTDGDGDDDGAAAAGAAATGGPRVAPGPGGRGRPDRMRGTPGRRGGGRRTMVPAPATIVVELPADANLKVDGAATKSTSNVRVLVSPNLAPGRDFQYTLTAQVVRDGKPVQVERVVTVRAGEQSRVRLTPGAEVALR